MTEKLHTCSYYCHRPECIRAQRDELRENYFLQMLETRRACRSACAGLCESVPGGEKFADLIRGMPVD